MAAKYEDGRAHGPTGELLWRRYEEVVRDANLPVFGLSGPPIAPLSVGGLTFNGRVSAKNLSSITLTYGWPRFNSHRQESPERPLVSVTTTWTKPVGVVWPSYRSPRADELFGLSVGWESLTWAVEAERIDGAWEVTFQIDNPTNNIRVMVQASGYSKQHVQLEKVDDLEPFFRGGRELRAMIQLAAKPWNETQEP